MTTTAHSVTPEDIMAFLDGELSASEAQAVSMHLDTCANCAALADDLRGTSQSLARWVVPAIPRELENRIHDFAVKTAARNKTIRPNRGSFRTWKPWVLGSCGAVVAVTLLIVLTAYRPQRWFAASRSEMELYSGSQPVPEHPSAEKSEPVSSVNTYAYASLSTPPPPPAAADGLVSYEMAGKVGKVPPKPSVAANPTPVSAPMIARTVALTIQVKDAVAARTALDQILTRHHGYSAQLTADTSENSARTLQASLRIPASELSAALADLKTLGRVQTESQAGEEVTQQHEDLVARLITARGTEERLRAILQQRAGRVSDVLEVEEEIARVRGEIEGLEADQQNLEHRVDFATIDIQLAEQFKAQLNSPADSATTRIHNAFVAGYRNATDTLLGFLLFFEEYGPTILIWMAVLAIPLWLAWRRYRRLHSNL